MGHTKQNNLKGTIYTRHLLGNLINDMPFEDYINEPDFIHSSEVKLFGQSMSHWETRFEQESTDGLRLGSGGHTLLLEFDKFNDRYLVMPKVDARSKIGKEQKLLAQEQAHQENKVLLSQDEFTQMVKGRDQIHDNEIISDLFLKNLGENEVSGFFKHPTIPDIKGCFRADKLLEDRDLCIDLKFMLSANKFAFIHSIKKFRYDIQASWYLDGLEAITGRKFDFLFVVCEKTRPFLVQTYRLDDESLEKGRDDTREYINRFKEYQNASPDGKKRLTGYYNGIQTLNIKWY